MSAGRGPFTAQRVRNPGRGLATVACVSVLATLAACGGSRAADLPAPGACAPVEGGPDADATLAGHDGEYALVLVSSDGSRSADGTLALRARSGERTSAGAAATPLEGTAEIDFPAVGAQAVTGLGSTDPAAPGVLVLEDDGSEGRTITVRFGSVANRSEDAAIDGAYTVLDVSRVGPAGFFGAWRSGVRLERTSGYFCAWSRAD